MSIQLTAYNGTDRAQLFWTPDQEIPDCRGFAIEKVDDKGNTTYIHGYATFSPDDVLNNDSSKPDDCFKAPIQSGEWYVPGQGEGKYRVVPVVGPDKDHLRLDVDGASDWVECNVTHKITDKIEVYFNHGLIADQAVAKYRAENPSVSLEQAISEPGNPLRDELSGDLRVRMLEMLKEADEQGKKVKLMLYELNDPELVEAIKKLGDRCEVILANGAFKNNKEGENDENAAVREELKKSGVLVDDRIVKLGHFDHDKVMIICDSEGVAETVFTGSTNWTKTGLCSQANNAVILHDAETANQYLESFERVKAAGDDYTAELLFGNSTPKTVHLPDGLTATPLFAPTNEAQDMEYVRKLINEAKGAFFLNFNPGVFQEDSTSEKTTLEQTILERRNPANADHFDPNFHISGVLNQPLKGLSFLDDTSDPRMADAYTGIVIPAAIRQAEGSFDEEQVKVAGTHAIVHSKYIVLDMGDDRFAIITGSHNMGFKASSKNDDNMIVIEGQGEAAKQMAIAYILNERYVHNRFQFNNEMNLSPDQVGEKVFKGPVDSDSWQKYMDTDRAQDHKYWMSGLDIKAFANGPEQPVHEHPKSKKAAAAVEAAPEETATETPEGEDEEKPSHKKASKATVTKPHKAKETEAEAPTRSHHKKPEAEAPKRSHHKMPEEAETKHTNHSHKA